LAKTGYRQAVPRAALAPLGLLFGALYFLQGIVEPGDGLIAQPTRALLERRGLGAGSIGDAMLLSSLPWAMKPLFGVLSDSLPIGGSRRRAWLALVSAAAAAALGVLALAPVEPAGWAFVACLAVATAGVAFADVVVDAHMVETAQPLGLTGPIQAIQWGSIYAAAALAGWAGGVISQAGAFAMAFGTAAVGSLLTLALALGGVREQAGAPAPVGPRATLTELGAALREPRLRAAATFLVLWSFSPGYGAVLDFHVTRSLGLDERTYGDATAVHAIACAAACGVYAAVCRRVRFAALLHAAIVMGAVSALAYAVVDGRASLLAVSAAGGATYMLASLALLDLAARVCPPRVAGSVFALLMALQNLSLSVATWLGGHVYEDMVPWAGPTTAYAALALAGAAASAGCWAVLPAVRRGLTS
jgi:hypothetical protein